MYADLCERIAHTPIACLGENPGTKDAGKGSKKFRKMLLIKCQDEFTKDWQGLFAAVQVTEMTVEAVAILCGGVDGERVFND